VNPYYQSYWDRFRDLQYDFLPGDRALEIALRFTLSIPGAHTMIVGTTKPQHLIENVRLAAAGILDAHQYQSIRDRWKKVAHLELQKTPELDGGRFVSLPELDPEIS
jgi:hypothetical protein